MVSLFSVEFPYTFRHPFLLFHGEFGENRKGKGFGAQPFGYWEIAFFMAQEAEAFLQVKTQRVVDAGGYASFLKKCLELVPLLYPYNVLVVYVVVARQFHRRGNRFQEALFGEEGVVPPGNPAALFVPLFKVV